jgi:hypothetical protein
MSSCVPKSRYGANRSQIDFAARGKDHTILITPVRLPFFSKVNPVDDTQKGYACVFRTKRNLTQPAAAMSDKAWAELSDPRAIKDNLEVLTPFPVSAESAIKIVVLQSWHKQVDAIRAQQKLQKQSQEDVRATAIGAGSVAGGTAVGALALSRAVADVDNFTTPPLSANTVVVNHAASRNVFSELVHGLMLSSLLENTLDAPNRYRNVYGIEDDDFIQRAFNRSTELMPQQSTPRVVKSPSNAKEVSEQLRRERELVKRLQILAREGRDPEGFQNALLQASRELEINIPFQLDANLQTNERLLEQIASVEALDRSLQDQHAVWIDGLRAKELYPASDVFWDKFVFAMREISGTPGGKARIGAGIAAVSAVAIGGGVLAKRALSAKNLDGLVKLSDQNIGHAEQQIVQLGSAHPASTSYRCQQELGR